MAISTAQVKELRDRTGVSIMQCHKALDEADGDMGKAIILLKKRGAEAVAKKLDRSLGAGVVSSYIHGAQVGAMIVLSCETDFVSKNEEFVNLAYLIAQQVAATNPTFIRVEEIDAASKRKAREAFLPELKGKPEAMHKKILEGKLTSYFKDQVLLEQDYIRDPNTTIKGLIEAAVQKFGERIEVSKIARFSVRS